MDHNHDASDKIVYGSCPVCDNWQVDVDKDEVDLAGLVAGAITDHAGEHDVDPTDVITTITITSVGDIA